MAHVCLRTRNNPPLLCVTGLQTAKLSGGHNPGPALICFCLARANPVLFHGWHAAAAVVVVIDGHVIGCPLPLSLCFCAISLWVMGDIRSANVPQCRPRNVRPCCYLSLPPPDCYRSLARRAHRNCRVHTEVGVTLGMGETEIPNNFFPPQRILYHANVQIFIRHQWRSREHLTITTKSVRKQHRPDSPALAAMGLSHDWLETKT